MNVQPTKIESLSDFQADEIPVVIAGGGLIGLSLSMFLAQHGIPSLAIEKLRGGSPLPRAAMFHQRTLEMYRSAGLEPDIIEQSNREFIPEGALVIMDTISGKIVANLIPVLNAGVDQISPSRRLFISQPGLEPILRKRAREVGAKLMEGWEVARFEQDADGVTVYAREVDTGKERRFRTKYLVGADGAHSKIREQLGIEFDGRGVFSNSITIYFTADLSPWIGGKPLSVIYVKNDKLSGFFRMDRASKQGFFVVNTVGDPARDPEAAANAAADVSEKKLIELLRIGIGDPAIPVKIDGVARWRATSDIARRYQENRVFLAGDAAHLMPPTGGFGGNTGIHDAHNLAWKLAFVLKGIAEPGLLKTYEAERRPAGKFTVEQAYSRYVTRTAPYLGAKDYQPVADDFNIEVGYLYHSDAVLGEGGVAKDHDDPRKTQGMPGSRAPHLWLEQRVSTIDLFDQAFVLLAAQDGGPWCDAARKVSKKFEGLPLKIMRVGSTELRDPNGRFTIDYGISNSGAVLVRPDAFVAWRAKSLDRNPETALTEAFEQILKQKPASPRREEPVTVRPAQTSAPAAPVASVAAARPADVSPAIKPAPQGFPGGFHNPFARPMPSFAGVKLYMHPVSMTSRPIRLFIAESGINLDQQVVDVMKGEHLAPEFQKKNPSQLVPMLEDGDFRLTESSAILKYLADKVGSPAYPSDPKRRAKIDEMMDWLNTQFYRDWAYNLCYPQLFPHHKRRSDEAHAGAIEWGKQNSRRWLQLLNDHWIGNNQYLVGNRITLADYFGSGLVTLGEAIHTDFNKYPNVARWLSNMKSLKNWSSVNEVFNGFVGSTKGKLFETV
jgi:2-polyprenyl-6-methoxyphenol hydroxylase-like FAD-dependent oxidoreductase/glutathione S-transferase